MNTTCESPVEPGSAYKTIDGARPSVLVWDAPVRVVHWLLAASFLGAFLTGESERWRLLHVTLGYAVAGLVAFRLVWGLIGTRHARFASFVRGPAAVARYLRTLVSGRPEHHAGHNPAGALAIVALLCLAAGVAVTGHLLYVDIGGDAAEEWHEALADGMLVVVGLHVSGVLVASFLHRENLTRAMLTGRKRADPSEAIQHAWRPLAAVVLAAVAAWTAWQYLATPPSPSGVHAVSDEARGHAGRSREHDDDRD